MLEFLKIYLIIGVGFISIEWALIIFGRKRLFESEKTMERVTEALSFFVEVVIWPRQVFEIIRISCKVINKIRHGIDVQKAIDECKEESL